MAKVWSGYLRDWLKTQLAAQFGGAPEVVLADTDNPRLDYEYGWFRQTGARRLGQPEIATETDLGRDAGEEVRVTARTRYELSVSVNVVGEGAVAALEAILLTLALPSTLETFRAADMSVGQLGPVRNLSGLVGPTSIERAQADLWVRVGASAYEDVGYIKLAEITETTGGLPDFTNEQFGDLS